MICLQFAIVFRTPPYMDCNIDRPVRVYIELKRISDSVKSDPREFIYLPEQTGMIYPSVLYLIWFL